MTAPLASDWAGWRWPVGSWNGRDPVISHEFEGGERFKRGPNGELVLNYATHLGLDLMHPWRNGDPTGPASTVALYKGAGRFIAPKGTLVMAAGPGKIWAAGVSKLGLHVQIDHGKVGTAGGVNTFYQHLESYSREWHRGDEVKAGDVLGVMGGDPANAPHLRHLHFELWFPRAGVMQAEWPVNPEPFMRLWSKA